jgi:hypothetical protein
MFCVTLPLGLCGSFRADLMNSWANATTNLWVLPMQSSKLTMKIDHDISIKTEIIQEISHTAENTDVL